MEERKDTPTNNQKDVSDTARPIPAISVDPAPIQQSTVSQRDDAPDRIKKSDKVMICATIVIALGTLASATAIVLQWREMVGSGKQTDALIKAAQTNASAAKSFADSAVSINTEISIAVDKLNQQAISTGKVADQALAQSQAAKITSRAADSTAHTAAQALHVTERAYIVTGAPQLDYVKKYIIIPFINTGHIPSGQVEVVAHTAVMNVPFSEKGNLNTAAEIHWKRTTFQSITPTVGMSISIPLTKMDSTLLKIGQQVIIVVGTISYSDGFKGTERQRWPFCIQTLYQYVVKESALSPCDASIFLPQIEAADGFPRNEQQ